MLPPQQPSIRSGGSLSWRAPLSHHYSTPAAIGRLPARAAGTVRTMTSSTSIATSSTLPSSSSAAIRATTQRAEALSSYSPRVVSTTTSSTPPQTIATTTTPPPPVTPPNSVVNGGATPPATSGGTGADMYTTIRAILEQLHQRLQTLLHTFKNETPTGRFITKAAITFSEKVMWLVNNVTNGTTSTLDAGIRLVVVGIVLLLCGRFAVCHVRRCLRGNKKSTSTPSPPEENVDLANNNSNSNNQEDGVIADGVVTTGGGSGISGSSDDDGGDIISASPCLKTTTTTILSSSSPTQHHPGVGVVLARKRDNYYTPARGGTLASAARGQEQPISPPSPSSSPATPVHFIPQGVSAAFYSLFMSPTSTPSTPPPSTTTIPTNSNKNREATSAADIMSENEFEVVERDGYIETYDVRAERERRRIESEKERRLSERYGNADEHVERLIASYSGSTMPPITTSGNDDQKGDDDCV